MQNNTMNIMSMVRDIAARFNKQKIDSCLDDIIMDRTGSCLTLTDKDEAVSVLAKAAYIRSLTENGLSLSQAMRELGRRMRAMRG